MVRGFTTATVSITLLIWLATSLNDARAAKDQSRINGESEPQSTSPRSPFNPDFKDEDFDLRDTGPSPNDSFEVLEPDDIPVIKSIELTLDIAKRAINALAEVRDKYNDKGIDDYDTLEEFVSKTEAGKLLEADVQRFGFENITDWNTSISSVGFAYLAIVDDEEAQIRQQISEIQIDPEISADEKEQLVSSLEAMIASANNKSIVRQLMRDAYYSKKIKLLEETE